jgi:hypothetical protein
MSILKKSGCEMRLADERRRRLQLCQMFLASSAAIGILSCGSRGMDREATAPAKHDFPKAFIGQPCSGVPAEQQASGETFARVFVQTAHLVSDEMPRPVGSWLLNHEVAIDSVGGVLAVNDAPVTLPLGNCIDPARPASECWKVIMTPHLPKRASDSLRLAVRVEGADPSVIRAQTTVVVPNQQSVVLDVPDKGGATGPISFVLTPYLIGGEENNREDLYRLLQCHAAARDAEMKRRGGT